MASVLVMSMPESSVDLYTRTSCLHRRIDHFLIALLACSLDNVWSIAFDEAGNAVFEAENRPVDEDSADPNISPLCISARLVILDLAVSDNKSDIPFFSQFLIRARNKKRKIKRRRVKK